MGNKSDILEECIIHDNRDEKCNDKNIDNEESLIDEYGKFFEFSPDYCYIVSPKGEILDINRSALDILDISKDEVIGKQIIPTVYASSNFQHARELVAKWKKDGYLRNEEILINTKEGVRVVILSVNDVRDEKGYLLYSILMQKDVTDFKNIQMSLKESKRRLINVLNNINEGITLSNESGEFEIFNQEIEKITGYSMIEANSTDDFNKLIYPDPEEQRQAMDVLNKLINDGDTYERETKIHTKNREIKDLLVSTTVNISKNKKLYFSVYRDITTQKKAKNALKIKDNAIDSSINAIMITDLKGKITYINKSFLDLWGYKKNDEIMGEHILQFWKSKGEFVEIMDSILEKKGWMGEIYAEKKDGSSFPVKLSASTIYDDHNKPIYMMASFIDITEQKKAEEKISKQNIKLKKLDQLKSAFLNITSHELRTPMSSIKGYVQMIQKKTLGEITNEQNNALNVVLRNTDRLDHLIQDILDISRLESGTMKFIPEKMDSQKIIQEVTETMSSSAEEKKIIIKTEIENNMPKIIVDQDRIKQVIINIINNAIKFSPNGSTIKLRTKKKDDHILFEIEDSGRGIPKDKQEKVFDTFYQVDSGVDRKFGGAGLGLAISRGIILAHGGKIWVESQENKGSNFKFILPIKHVKDLEERFKEIDVFRLEAIS